MGSAANPFHTSLEDVATDGSQAITEVPGNAHLAEPEAMKVAVEEKGQEVHAMSVERHEHTEPSASWIQATFHTVTAVVGAGILGLPNAFSYLGFVGGSFFLLFAGGSALYTACLLSTMHEMNGTRYNRYRDLGTAVLGKKYSNMFIAPFQFSVMVGLAIAYTITAGNSLKVIEELASGCDISERGGQIFFHCDVNLTKYLFLFAAVNLALSQIPSVHHLWWVSIVGAVMSLGYSLLAGIVALAALNDEGHEPTYNPRGSGWPLWRNILNALGQITFAYGGHSVLLEIQATLKTPPSAKKSMIKGVVLANAVSGFCYFFVALTGYAAYGDTVADDVLASHPRPAKAWITIANLMVWLHVLASYQVFAQPIFEALERALLPKFPHMSVGAFRIIARSFYVILITMVAATFPFFGEIIGLIGAVGFIPMTFILPHVLWLASQSNLGWSRIANWGLLVAFSVIAVLALIGSVAAITVKSSQFETSWS